MNAFKLLSRSTRLAKDPQKSDHVNIQSQRLTTSNPPSAASAATTTPSKKRKLSHDHKTQNAVKENLNFFGDDDTADSARSREHPKSESSSRGTKEEQNVAGEVTFEPLPADQSRRILQTHKIKITTISEHSSEPDEGKARKRKRKDKDEASHATKPKKTRQERIVEPVMTYSQLRPRFGIHRRITENLAQQGYTVPTEIQMGSLPILLENDGQADNGKVDLLSIAPTGSGKTLAFLIPVINGLKQSRNKAGPEAVQRPEAIILAPTKELASQIVNEARKLALNTGIKITFIRKGMKLITDDENVDAAPMDEPESAEEDGLEQDAREAKTIVKSSIVVSTPGTMLQALSASDDSCKMISSIQYLVLDEADVLLDPLFREQTLSIWRACTNVNLRVSLWSATMGSSIEDLAQTEINNRWTSLPSTTRSTAHRAPLVRIVVGLKDSAIPTIKHKMIYAANEQGKLMALRQLLRPTAKAHDSSPPLRPPFLVFTQTIERAVALHSELSYDIPAEAGGSTRIAVLHSDLSESHRDRTMTRFRKGEIWVLITTDLLSRGVDFRGVNGVVNYDFPNSSAAYVHRVGRTGRAGREGGVAVTLYAEEDIPYVKNVANVIAASEKLKSGGKVDDMTRWLVESLPKTSKRDKQRLKKRGVESRRPGKVKDENGVVNKSRISTKSGFERREENKRRGAIEGSKARAERQKNSTARAINGGDGDKDGDEFAGFD